MTDLLYGGTLPVSVEQTQALLVGPFGAIWSPPVWRYTPVSRGDRLWLLWRGSPAAPPLLLGLGGLATTSDDRVSWTNRTAPGIVAAARKLGYSGPTNMAFLQLKSPRTFGPTPEVAVLKGMTIGLSEATGPVVAALEACATASLD
jgi:hypothetical protein